MQLSTRLAIAMVALVFATAAGIGLLTYRDFAQRLLPGQLFRMEVRARSLADKLADFAAGGRSDIVTLRAAPANEGFVRAKLAGGIDPEEGIGELRWRDRLIKTYVAQMKAQPDTLRIGLVGIGGKGRELLRVERVAQGERIRDVPEGELEELGARDDYERAAGLAADDIDISPIELSRSSAQGARGPIIRIATPVHLADGRLGALLVITLDMRAVFATIARRADNAYQTFVVNERGDYLVHPDPTRTFGFVFGEPSRWQNDFPELAAVVRNVDTETHLVTSAGGEQRGIAMASAYLAGGPRVSVIEAAPYALLMGPAYAAGRSTLIVALAAAIVALGVAILIARSLTRPLVAMTRSIEAFGRGEPMNLPVDAGGDIGTLSRAFSRIAAEMGEKTAALSKEVAERRQLFETSLDLILIVDRHGGFFQVSPSALMILGYRPEEMIGRNGAEFVCAGDLEATRNEMRLARRGQMTRNFECRYLHKDGHIVTLQWAGAWSELVQRHFFIGRDLTEKIAAEAQLHQAQKMDAIGQLTGGIAHDFNNILTVITGTVEIMIDGVADRPQLHTIALMIDQAASRGAELTRQLLAFARRQPLQPRAVDANVLILETASMLRTTLGEHIEIRSVLTAEPWLAVADLGQLTTALLNLAVNARDAMPRGGKLTLETANLVFDEAYARAHAEVRPGCYVMIAVSDTGKGIPAAIVEKVFEPFFTTKDVGKGTGLGLSMVYGFVKQSGGHIGLDSEEGCGTTIKLYLPRADASAAAPAASGPAPRLPRGNEKILVVEDDALVRKYVVKQLASLGYTSLSAANAAEALEQVSAGAAFDLLFTDMIMPGKMNGRELAAEVAKLRPGTRVLFTSGYTEDAIVLDGNRVAGIALLSKPYRKIELAAKLRAVLDAPLVSAA
jgi:PAS domain S-box-containing protein